MIRCEASRALKWHITNTGVSTPSYRVTLPSTDPTDDEEQPLFQVSKTTPNAPHYTLTYYTYAVRRYVDERAVCARQLLPLALPAN